MGMLNEKIDQMSQAQLPVIITKLNEINRPKLTSYANAVKKMT